MTAATTVQWQEGQRVTIPALGCGGRVLDYKPLAGEVLVCLDRPMVAWRLYRVTGGDEMGRRLPGGGTLYATRREPYLPMLDSDRRWLLWALPGEILQEG